MASYLQNFVRFLTEDYYKSDEFYSTFIPILVYWTYSGMYMMLFNLDKYRLHPRKEAEIKNSVTKTQVVRGVLVQESVQTIVLILMFWLTGGTAANKAAASSAAAAPSPSLLLLATQFLVGMLVTDTYQYFTHRYMHTNKFLYRRVHAVHHKVVVTHAFGALYGHAVGDGIVDTVGSGLAFFVTGMSPRTGIYFFSFSVIKVIDDHCGMWLPGNPFHVLFSNNSAFHDFHHQLGCGNYNYSQPFFIMWDKIMGTYMPVTVEKRKEEEGAGFVVKSAKDQ